MEITTENITTYEPIISIVEIELEELTLGLYELWGRFCKSFLLKNLKITPTVIHAIKWVIKSNKPILLLANKPIPTVPIINKGPELFVNASILLPSSLVQIPLFLKSVTILAPTGYPLISPIINAKEPSPGTLKSGLIILFKVLPKYCTILVLPNNSVANKKEKEKEQQ